MSSKARGTVCTGILGREIKWFQCSSVYNHHDSSLNLSLLKISSSDFHREDLPLEQRWLLNPRQYFLQFYKILLYLWFFLVPAFPTISVEGGFTPGWLKRLFFCLAFSATHFVNIGIRIAMFIHFQINRSWSCCFTYVLHEGTTNFHSVTQPCDV